MARPKNPINVKRDEIRAWFDNCDVEDANVRDHILRAVRIIWARQTPTEQLQGQTRELNGEGFGYADAEFAESVIKWADSKGALTVKFARAARKMIRKYAKQLAIVQLTKEARQCPTAQV